MLWIDGRHILPFNATAAIFDGKEAEKRVFLSCSKKGYMKVKYVAFRCHIQFKPTERPCTISTVPFLDRLVPFGLVLH